MGIASYATCPVVGVTFTPHYPDNLHALRVVAEEAETKGEKLPVVLIRNPANEYDSNAIEVHVPALGDAGFIGHVPRWVAEKYAPEMDAGTKVAGMTEWVRIDPNHPDRPGITIGLQRVDDEGPL